MGAIRTGHTPLWGARRGKGGSWLWRLLASPLILWEYLFYQRPNVTTEKTRPADWARLQSEWRFWDALVCYVGPPSHFLWNIKCPLLGTMVVSCVVVLYEYGRTQLGWNVPDLDKSNVMNDAYRLSSFAMSLLLSLRLGRAYERWWSARCTFAGVGSAASTLVGQAVAWIDSPQLRNDIRRWAVVWHYSILHICTAAEDLHPKGAALLGEEELALYRASRKPRQLAYQQLRLLVVQGKRHGLSEDAALAMDATIVKGVSDAGTCVRIKFQALPQTLTLVSTGFLQIWLLLVPLGLQGEWLELVAVFFTALLLLSVDEAATQLENPFPMLPLEEILDSTVRDTARTLEEAEALRELQHSCSKRLSADSDVVVGVGAH